MVGRQSRAPPENVPINKGNRPEQIAPAVSTSRSRECGRWMAAPDATDRVAGGGGAGPRGQVAVQEGPGAGTLGPGASGGPGERKARGELARQAAAVQTRPEPPGVHPARVWGAPMGSPTSQVGNRARGRGRVCPRSRSIWPQRLCPLYPVARPDALPMSLSALGSWPRPGQAKRALTTQRAGFAEPTPPGSRSVT